MSRKSRLPDNHNLAYLQKMEQKKMSVAVPEHVAQQMAAEAQKQNGVPFSHVIVQEYIATFRQLILNRGENAVPSCCAEDAWAGIKVILDNLGLRYVAPLGVEPKPEVVQP